MDRFLRLGTAVFVGGYALVLSLAPVRVALADPTPSEEPSISSLIVDLDSHSYDVRKEATERLIAAGADASLPLVAAVEQGSREVMMRAIHVLSRQARSRDPVVEEAARTALSRTMQTGPKPAATRAQAALAAVDRWRQSAALAELQQLGARTTEQMTYDRIAFPVSHIASNELIIGEDWRGRTEDLRQLRWLTDLQQLYLFGKRITDAEMEHVARIPNLESIVMIRTGLTDDGIAQLAEMPSLRFVDIQYTPVSDKAIEHLTGMEHLRQVRLRGTNVSSAAAEALAKRLGEGNIDYHHGALLGIEADPTILAANGCPVKDAAPGSAAAGVGLRGGDVIVGVNDEKVDSFETLRQLMAKRRGGEKIVVHYRRNNKQQKVDVVLGEWYAEGNSEDAAEPADGPDHEQEPDTPAMPEPAPRIYPARR